MPRVEVLTKVPGRDPESMLIEHVPSETLANEHDADHFVERMGWASVEAEQQSKEFHAHNGGSAAAVPARSVRRATARRASNRRATARSRQGDTEASIIDFLAQHPGSTAGDLAKGLNLNRGSVAARLTQLAEAGEITKASHGYIQQEASDATPQTPAPTPSLNTESSPESTEAPNRARPTCSFAPTPAGRAARPRLTRLPVWEREYKRSA